MDWLDHQGGIISGPDDAEPTGWEKHANLTHRLMRPRPGQLIQAISWCGRRIHEVPGRGELDCPECLALLHERYRAAACSTAPNALALLRGRHQEDLR